MPATRILTILIAMATALAARAYACIVFESAIPGGFHGNSMSGCFR